jgi:hypothetical protein
MANKIITSLIIISIVTRFIALGATPAHLSNDEIGAAYDAYSISKTLRDEHNTFLPITFKSHGVYRSALAVYLLIPSVALLGNTDYAARLPSALLGSLSIVLVGLLVWELSRKKKLALLSSLVLAYSPWHISASRSAIEANLALFFVVLGIYLFIFGYLHDKKSAVLGSYASFAISLYGYYTEWGLTPLILVSLLFFYRKTIATRKVNLYGLVLFLLLSFPLLADFINKLTTSRASTELLIHEPSVRTYLFNNYNIFLKAQVLISAFIGKYSGYLNLKYIFFNGSHFLPNANPYQIGIFLFPLVIPFLCGLVIIKKYFHEHSNFLYALFFITPIVPALSRGDVSSLRNLPSVIPYSIIIASGLYFLYKKFIKKTLLKLTFSGLIIISFSYFAATYIYHYPIQRAEDFQYGFEQMSRFIQQHYQDYEKIIIDPRFGNKDFYYYGVPHVYIPYYTYMDPVKIQNNWQVPNGIAYDKYEFRFVDWEAEKIQEKYLYIVPQDNNPDMAPENFKEIGEIQLPNHQTQFRFYAITK